MNRRVLIIDDSPATTLTTRLLLQKLGSFEVCEENHPRRAVATARGFQPDVILLDLTMPDLDGGCVAQLLESDPALANVPIIFFTAAIEPDEVERLHGTWGGMRFISKPMRPKAMMRTLADALAESGRN